MTSDPRSLPPAPFPGHGAAGPLVTIRGLTVDYGKIRALSNLAFELHPGPTGLLGPNGAGKTTLLRVLLGLVAPRVGEVLVAGFDPRRRSDRLQLRRVIGYMPEGDCLIPGMNGFELVATLARVSGMSHSDSMTRAHEVLYYVGLEEVRYRDCQTYSTGMKQRLKLAQALVHDPAVLLLDEPTNGLDPRGRVQMLDLIADLATNHQKSLLLCSHLLPDVERVCRDVVVLQRGEVVASGAIAAITRGDERRLKVEVRGDAAVFARVLVAAGFDTQADADGRLEVALPEGLVDADEVFRLAESAGVVIARVLPLKTSLEDVFLRALSGGGSSAAAPAVGSVG